MKLKVAELKILHAKLVEIIVMYTKVGGGHDITCLGGQR